MASFRDSANRTWHVVFTSADVARVKATAGIDVKAAAAPQVLRGVGGTTQADFESLTGMLFTHMRVQAQGYGLSLKVFRQSLCGPHMAAALEAVRSALTELETADAYPKTIRSSH